MERAVEEEQKRRKQRTGAKKKQNKVGMCVFMKECVLSSNVSCACHVLVPRARVMIQGVLCACHTAVLFVSIMLQYAPTRVPGASLVSECIVLLCMSCICVIIHVSQSMSLVSLFNGCAHMYCVSNLRRLYRR